VLELRQAVLRKPLKMNLFDEDLSQEKGQLIFVTMYGEQVVGCVMLKVISTDTVKLRQMAVSEQHQGKRVGTQLVGIFERWCFQNGYSLIETHAREYAQDFYLKLGYSIKGERFTEVGLPHRFMFKQLTETNLVTSTIRDPSSEAKPVSPIKAPEGKPIYVRSVSRGSNGAHSNYE
jgi:predicted GNAT family N-acyltransferase